MATHFMAVFCVESNALNTLFVFDNNFWDLEIFWMITHFVAVFCVESNAVNTLLVFDNNFWDLEIFLDDHTFCGGLLCGN